ncbi:MAG: hypothetical protein ACOC01_00780 [Bacteroidales bacterium]
MKPKYLLLTMWAVMISFASAAQTEALEDFSEKQRARLDKSNAPKTEVPNTNVHIAPPADFDVQPSINGFIHKGSSTSIQVIEIHNVCCETVIKSLSKNYFKEQGFELIKSERIRLHNGDAGKLYLTKYTAGEENYRRIFFFTGINNTVWININYPTIVEGLIYKPIVASLKTVSRG